MSHLLLQHKSLVRSRNRRLCWQRPSQNTCFSNEIPLIMKWPSLLHDSSERCVSMFCFQCIRLLRPVVLLRGTTPEPSVTMSEDFSNFFVLILWEVHVTIIFCSSCGRSWGRMTTYTRFYRPKRPSIVILINIFCGLKRFLHPFGPDFDAIFNSLLLAESTDK